MKNTIKALAVLAILGFSGSAFAQSSATANGNASGYVITPIGITTNQANVQFGQIVQGTAGTVTEANGADNYSNTQLSPGGHNLGTISDASFTITGWSGAAFAWTLTNNNLGSNGLTIGGFVATTNSGAGILGTGNSSGTGTVGEGSTLAVGATATLTNTVPEGQFNYGGAFTLSVNYN
jgi:hypothetical protein